MRRWGAIAATLCVAACIDLSTDPDEIVAIQFSELPWPSIVAGDTLRDSTGAVAALRARLFDGSGDEVTAPVEFLSREPKLQIVDGALVVASDTATGSAGLLASISGLQSIVRQIEVVAAPDSIAHDGTITPLSWVVPDNVTTNTSAALAVRVFNTDDTAVGVRSWIVSFDLQVDGTLIARSDTSKILLVNDLGRPSYADTTDTQGRASRRVRLIPAANFSPDSAVISVRAWYKGVPVTGSPVRLVLPLQPR